jgi:uncharacterized protein YjbI with pentapeptide repeats
VIIGHLYGSLVPEKNISFSEAEYQEAKRQGKPCLVYLRHPDIPVKPEFFERDAEKIKLLEQFTAALHADHTVDTFRSAKDLEKKVTSALRAAVDRFSARGRDQYLALLKQGPSAWNKWRTATQTTGRANDRRSHPKRLDLSGMDLRSAPLRRVDLSNTIMSHADLSEADLREANLRDTDLSGARLVGTDLHSALLKNTNLSEANLTRANLNGADLTGANLILTRFIETDLRNARIKDCHVFGISAWSLNTDGAKQSGLVISAAHEPTVTVDDIEVAQLNYLMMRSGRIRNVINSLQTRSVLVLGRFSAERKTILEAIKDELRRLDFMPIVFDFERPAERDFTESVMTLAAMSLFIVADITNPRTSPVELSAILPHYRIPLVPIIQKGQAPFAMFADLRKYPWVLPVLQYGSVAALRKIFQDAVVRPAMHQRQKLDVRSSNDLV